VDEKKILEKGDGKDFFEEIRMKQGKKYPVRIQYLEKRQNAHIRLSWTLPAGKREIIPDKALFVSDEENAANGLQAVYRSLKQTVAYTRNRGNIYATALEWPGEFLELQVPEPPPQTKITLLGKEGELPWKWQDGMLHIDLRDIGFDGLPSCYAWTFRIEGAGK
jgi:hypothetical protein